MTKPIEEIIDAAIIDVQTSGTRDPEEWLIPAYPEMADHIADIRQAILTALDNAGLAVVPKVPSNEPRYGVPFPQESKA